MNKKTDHDAALDAFIADVAQTADRRAAAPPRLDFGEVLRRAQTLDPSATTKAMIDEAAELATVVRLAPRRQPAESPADPALDDFLRDVRTRNEAIADDRQLAGIPPQAPRTPPSRRPQIAALFAIAASFALFLLVGSPRFALFLQGPSETSQALMQGVLERSYRARNSAREGMAMSAELDADENPDADSIRRGQRRPEATSPEPETGSESGSESAAAMHSNESGAPADLPAEAAKADSTAAPATAKHLRRPKASADELAALDKAAQEAWRRGDLETAAKSFRKLLRRDRGGRWTQLAYGDLFTLTRQRGDRRAELSLWREYLRRHPKGPHADDAHAGICRRSAAQKRRNCWKNYLKARPNGAYRQQAELAQSESEDAGEAR